MAVVLDLFDLRPIGVAYATTMSDDLVIKALQNAINNRKIDPNVIFHLDRGSQYTSGRFVAKLKEMHINHSYSKRGCPYDNACMEPFNSILKKEEVNVSRYQTFEEAKMKLFQFVEGWYVNVCLHSSLGYKTPKEYYEDYLKS